MTESLDEVEELVERRQAAVGIEFHKEVGIAGLRIEIRTARRLAKDFEPRYAVASAEFGQFFLLVSDGGMHVKSSRSGCKRGPSSTSSQQRIRQDPLQLVAHRLHFCFARNLRSRRSRGALRYYRHRHHLVHSSAPSQNRPRPLPDCTSADPMPDIEFIVLVRNKTDVGRGKPTFLTTRTGAVGDTTNVDPALEALTRYSLRSRTCPAARRACDRPCPRQLHRNCAALSDTSGRKWPSGTPMTATAKRRRWRTASQ